jgi:hypothetical protein
MNTRHKAAPERIDRLHELALCWAILQSLSGIVGLAAELGELGLGEQCHRLALYVAPRVGASRMLIRRMEQDHTRFLRYPDGKGHSPLPRHAQRSPAPAAALTHRLLPVPFQR